MNTNRGPWQMRRGMLVSVSLLFTWLLTAIVERVGREGVALWEAIHRLHPGQYVLMVIVACLVGLIVAWPRRDSPK
jgi:ABC-type antimicrobial peptide transport system permease subunit